MILFVDEYVTDFQTKTKEMYEVSFFEISNVLVDETGILMNVSNGGADGGQMKTC